MFKRFKEWISVKECLDSNHKTRPFVSERDIWWVAFGENVGSEINGKSKDFTRPGLILKKLSHKLYLVAPTTTKVHIGSWYVHIRFKNIDEYICLNQIRIIDHKRLHTKLGQISRADFLQVKKGFGELYI